MKVKIAFTVDVDVDAWAHEFHMDRDDVRDDVRKQAEALMDDYLVSLSLLGKEHA